MRCVEQATYGPSAWSVLLFFLPEVLHDAEGLLEDLLLGLGARLEVIEVHRTMASRILELLQAVQLWLPARFLP